MDCFDADAVIYAAVRDHALGRRVFALLSTGSAEEPSGAGSVMLLPEVLSRPLRDSATDELQVLAWLLAKLDLRPVDLPTAELATVLAGRYRLRAADAVHLATAVGIGADRFITTNARDFPKTIVEIDVVYPSDLPDPG